MRNTQHINTLNEAGSTRANIVIIMAGIIAFSVWLLIGQKPAQKAEETRSRNQDALEEAGFGNIGEKVYGKKTK